MIETTLVIHITVTHPEGINPRAYADRVLDDGLFQDAITELADDAGEGEDFEVTSSEIVSAERVEISALAAERLAVLRAETCADFPLASEESRGALARAIRELPSPSTYVLHVEGHGEVETKLHADAVAVIMRDALKNYLPAPTPGIVQRVGRYLVTLLDRAPVEGEHGWNTCTSSSLDISLHTLVNHGATPGGFGWTCSAQDARAIAAHEARHGRTGHNFGKVLTVIVERVGDAPQRDPMYAAMYDDDGEPR